MRTIPYDEAVPPKDWERFKDLVVDHCPSAREMAVICTCLDRSARQKLRYLEVGCHRGATMLGISRSFGPNSLTQLVGIDPGDQVPVEKRLPIQVQEYLPLDEIGALAKGDPRCEFFLGTHHEYHQAQARDDNWPLFDVVFIDADHSFAGVRMDIELARYVCHGDGFLVWHDVHNPLVPEVDLAIEAFEEANPKAEVLHVEGTTIAYMRNF